MTVSPAQTSRVFAVVPAAGRSRRMGRLKQLLDVRGRSMLEAVLQPLVAADVAGIALVIHEDVAERLSLPEDSRLHVVRNDDERTEMIDSIRIGLGVHRGCEQVTDADGYMVCPADQPGITTADFDRCITAFRAAPDKIIVATRAGKRGHPIVFPAALASFVESAACDQGLNALPRRHAGRVAHVECQSAGVCRDVDTPGDYQGLE
jgi:molybdenum cofactor cytidylyltransferase